MVCYFNCTQDLRRLWPFFFLIQVCLLILLFYPPNAKSLWAHKNDNNNYYWLLILCLHYCRFFSSIISLSLHIESLRYIQQTFKEMSNRFKGIESESTWGGIEHRPPTFKILSLKYILSPHGRVVSLLLSRWILKCVVLICDPALYIKVMSLQMPSRNKMTFCPDVFLRKLDKLVGIWWFRVIEISVFLWKTKNRRLGGHENFTDKLRTLFLIYEINRTFGLLEPFQYAAMWLGGGVPHTDKQFSGRWLGVLLFNSILALYHKIASNSTGKSLVL